MVDISAGYTRFVLRGVAVCEVLARCCGLDFDFFPIDSCARTRLANLAVSIDRRAAERWDLYLSRSYSPYCRGYLEDAAGLCVANSG